MPETIRILLTDDHLVLRAGLKALLETERDFRVVGEASTGEEALSNVARHSQARSARVDLEIMRSAVQVVVSDTGRGFSVEEEMARGGLGLFGMQERGAYLGGTVEIDSRPGHGTRVRVTIPTLETARYA